MHEDTYTDEVFVHSDLQEGYARLSAKNNHAHQPRFVHNKGNGAAH